MVKSLMKIDESQLQPNDDSHTETGVGFAVCHTEDGIIAVQSDGKALPFFDSQIYYNVFDAMQGTPLPDTTRPYQLQQPQRYPSRASAIQALRALNIAPRIAPYLGTAGAVPLLKTYRLAADTVFYRYVAASSDHRYSSTTSTLAAKTYLSPHLDTAYLNSGFAVVGRLALPIPLPAIYVFYYQVPKNTLVSVGTVAPAFGQAGGGVEVYLQVSVVAKQAGPNTIFES